MVARDTPKCSEETKVGARLNIGVREDRVRLFRALQTHGVFTLKRAVPRLAGGEHRLHHIRDVVAQFRRLRDALVSQEDILELTGWSRATLTRRPPGPRVPCPG